MYPTTFYDIHKQQLCKVFLMLSLSSNLFSPPPSLPILSFPHPKSSGFSPPANWLKRLNVFLFASKTTNTDKLTRVSFWRPTPNPYFWFVLAINSLRSSPLPSTFQLSVIEFLVLLLIISLSVEENWLQEENLLNFLVTRYCSKTFSLVIISTALLTILIICCLFLLLPLVKYNHR